MRENMWPHHVTVISQTRAEATGMGYPGRRSRSELEGKERVWVLRAWREAKVFSWGCGQKLGATYLPVY